MADIATRGGNQSEFISLLPSPCVPSNSGWPEGLSKCHAAFRALRLNRPKRVAGNRPRGIAGKDSVPPSWLCDPGRASHPLSASGSCLCAINSRWHTSCQSLSTFSLSTHAHCRGLSIWGRRGRQRSGAHRACLVKPW